MEKIIATQPQIQIIPTIDKAKNKSFPVVSIVKGMTFVLVDLTEHPEIFAALQAGQAPEAELDPTWSPSYVGSFYYKVQAHSEQPGEPTIHNLQARMIAQGIEDAGTGSASSALACYLALQSTSPSGKPEASEAGTELAKQTEGLKLEEKTERKVFGIQQGVEMGRLSTIAVEVDVKTDAQGKVSLANVILSGRATVHLKGELIGA
jgi:predicted PhzF superfamily epimerase YddE/YHI9